MESSEDKEVNGISDNEDTQTSNETTEETTEETETYTEIPQGYYEDIRTSVVFGDFVLSLLLGMAIVGMMIRGMSRK